MELETIAYLSGIVVHGDGRGRLLGFPTANLALSMSQYVPADGIYVCLVAVGAMTHRFGGTLSIGANPTFHGVDEKRVEVHLHDFDRDIYGCRISIQMLYRLRGTVRFESAKELMRQSGIDVAASRALISQSAGGV